MTMTPTEQPQITAEFEQLWDDLIASRDEVADLRECINGAYECMDSVNNFLLLMVNHPDSKEFSIWRKAIFQYLARLQKNLARGIEREETTDDDAN